ncbi:glyceraldehyde 3-phosphate dehydrogenase [Flavobacteriales bacterium]|nr:Glyceraldehyde-3-phosphate dehydrogenase [Flavobacteriales bacterium]MCL4815194.1 type I glyceraldehyde-3-phosphate dehydrogenase [Flavobacteriales bacterium]WKZ75628.1 MAG: type I glyceraldehyde-3-phosphate dehydrogenase [Vicingaceae bacterium]GIK69168.1 MAG: type I glyceraldehyde-3-phosphate dehydrogenase [Bacteroidota bacterium]CAG0949850.1 glyceraldehyde 3-phosphate dehydrogenase [Flavobacteriales bacterium]
MIRIAINGFGRIGRVLTRVIQKYPEIQLVAINDLADAKTLAHLLKYDSIHRLFPNEISCNEELIFIGGNSVKVFKERDPALLPWKSLGVDIVVESTGFFTDKQGAGKHIQAGAKKVIISAPPKDADIKAVVMGINDSILDGTENIISNASCTTNCAAPMVKVLDELCGIENGYIITVHSYTTDQRLQDAPHKDLRRARAAAESIVPTSTGAAKAITKIFPHLEGKLGGSGIRVPVPDGSLTDVTCTVKNVKNIEEINNAFKKASETTLKGILQYGTDPVVSSDIIGNPFSCVFDTELTSVIGNMVKVVGWYDNEMGYSNRLAELIKKIA